MHLDNIVKRTLAENLVPRAPSVERYGFKVMIGGLKNNGALQSKKF